MIVTIAAEVNGAGQVTLTSDQPGLPKGDTFRLKHGDTVKWQVRGALGGMRLQVRIVEFPAAADRRRLFQEGSVDTLPAATDLIVGTIDRRAHQGHYRYEVALVGGPQPRPLQCLWASVAGGPALPLDPAMGGGVQTDPPPR